MKRIAGILKDFFALHQQKVTQATAPGRLDIMGGVTDLAGGLLLQKALEQPSTAYLAVVETKTIRIQYYFQSEHFATFETELDPLVGQFPTLNYDYIREAVKKIENGPLALPLLASLLVFYEQKEIKYEGVDLMIISELPLHKGVGITASYEIAMLRALAEYHNVTISDYELPSIALRAENLIANNPTGGGAQFVSQAAKHQTLTVFRASPPEIFHPIEVPDTIHFMGIDTGELTSSDSEAYEDYRAAVFMGYSIVALASGATLQDLEVARNTGDRSAIPYQGNIGQINPSEFEDKFLPILPESLSGDDFYHQYKTTIDDVAFIDRDKTYAIRNCAKHPVYENFRVKLFAQILKNYSTEFQDYSSRLNLLGELMFQSHQSYSECGLGNETADLIVQRVKEIGSKKGLYGARITDSGNGGTVCILSSGISGPEQAAQLHQELQNSLNKQLFYFV